MTKEETINDIAQIAYETAISDFWDTVNQIVFNNGLKEIDKDKVFNIVDNLLKHSN